MRQQRLLYLILALLATDGFAAGLRDQLQTLARTQSFTVEGLSRLGDETAVNATGTPIEQVRQLLQDYNYVLTQARPGVIGQLRIISRRGDSGGKASAKSASLATRRVGAHHQVEVTLIGPNRVARPVPLLIDTGATTIVLPASMIGELGFAAEDLHEGSSQTASGTVPIKLGVLRSVRVGGVSAANVNVSFIADQQLNGNRLLGMSFLQHFKVTIDDASQELILLAR